MKELFPEGNDKLLNERLKRLNQDVKRDPNHRFIKSRRVKAPKRRYRRRELGTEVLVQGNNESTSDATTEERVDEIRAGICVVANGGGLNQKDSPQLAEGVVERDRR